MTNLTVTLFDRKTPILHARTFTVLRVRDRQTDIQTDGTESITTTGGKIFWSRPILEGFEVVLSMAS